VDLSPTMVAEACRRAAAEGLGERCKFLVQDLSELNTGGRYDLVLGVTVLQHILDVDRLRNAIRRLANHLQPSGRMVLLEAAPTRSNRRCDSAIFQARTFDSYLTIFNECGLRPEVITGVDPTPLRPLFLPYYGRLPKPLGLLGLAAATALSIPVDALLGRRLVARSWHKVFVLQHDSAEKHDA
jgi:SAM-dependent methyltransferase